MAIRNDFDGAFIQNQKKSGSDEGGTNMKRAVGICLIFLGATAGLSCLFFYEQYSSTRPVLPMPLYGQTVEEDNHGHIFFISKSEDQFLWHLTLGGILLLGTGGLLLKEK